MSRIHLCIIIIITIIILGRQTLEFQAYSDKSERL